MNSMFNINDFRGDEKKKEEKKKKFDFKLRKDKTFTSLKEVNKFLCNFHQLADYVTLYKILK